MVIISQGSSLEDLSRLYILRNHEKKVVSSVRAKTSSKLIFASLVSMLQCTYSYVRHPTTDYENELYADTQSHGLRSVSEINLY